MAKMNNFTGYSLRNGKLLPIGFIPDFYNQTSSGQNISIMMSLNLTDDGTPIEDFSNDPLRARLNVAIKWLSVSVLVEVMLGLGCAVQLKDLKEHIKRPVGVGIAALCQFVLMPLIVFGVSKAAKLAKVPAVVALVTVSVPGGTLSNILAYLIKGDMSLSMLMTTCSSILAFALIPFNLFIYGSTWLPVDTDYKHLIPYPSIIISLVLLLVPVTVGVLTNWKRPNIAAKIMLACKILLVASITSLSVLAGIVYKDTLLRFMPKELWLLCVILPPIGYILGYGFSTIFRLNDITRRTVAIETMCQNGQLGCAILKVAFPSQLIGSFFIFPLLYSVFQLTLGLILVAFFRFREKKEKMETIEDKTNIIEDGGENLSKLRQVSLYAIDKMRQSFRRIRTEDKLPIISSRGEEKFDAMSMSSSKFDVISLGASDKAENAPQVDENSYS